MLFTMVLLCTIYLARHKLDDGCQKGTVRQLLHYDSNRLKTFRNGVVEKHKNIIVSNEIQ